MTKHVWPMTQKYNVEIQMSKEIRKTNVDAIVFCKGKQLN